MTSHETLTEDREAIEDAISAIERSTGSDLWPNCLIFRMCKAIFDILKVIENLEKVDGQNKERQWAESEWIRKPGIIGWILSEYQCSKCKGIWVGALNPPRYCGHCGARMKNGGIE